jgi:S-adenosylmethionine decarboxylase
VAAAGLTVVGDYFHQFPGGGVTGTVVLAESHLAVHTWPESNYVTLDVFVCNMSCDNRAKARQLFDALVLAFLPGETRRYHLERV